LSANKVSGYESGGSSGFYHDAVAIADEFSCFFGNMLFFFYMQLLVFKNTPMY